MISLKRNCSGKCPSHEQGADEHNLYSVSRPDLPFNQHEHGAMEAERVLEELGLAEVVIDDYINPVGGRQS